MYRKEKEKTSSINLYVHKDRTVSPQNLFQGIYELCHFDYELYRETNAKGEIISDTLGGIIRVVIGGFGDNVLFHWLFRTDIEENGEIVTIDKHEQVIEKFSFSRAKIRGYKLHFDTHAKPPVATILTIEAKEIVTDKDLFFEKK